VQPTTGEAVAIAVNSSSSIVSVMGAFGPTAFPDYTDAWAAAAFS